ncbi:MAG TPA: polysaccharide biosynthesis tyrosine autokinase [Gemmatimonadaceae bacterium]|nr:polysaccharide biosynthesis tyrosine autokinase [Gemmatimonadaceae bacterium]
MSDIPPFAPPYATPLAVHDAGIPWARYLAAIWRYKWLVMLTLLLGAAGGFAAARRVRPSYEAHATLWVSTDRRGGPQFGQSEELVNNSSWVDLLRSYSVLERAARRSGIFVVPAASRDRALFSGFALRDSTRSGAFVLRVDPSGARYTLSTAGGATIETGAAGDSIGRSLGFLWQPPADQLTAGSEHAFSVRSLRDAANDIASRLTTIQPDNTSFIRLTLTGGDPVATAAQLNILTEEFIATSTDLKKRTVVAQTATLLQQRSAAQASLASAEAALARFRVASATLPSDANTATPRSASAPILNQYLDARTELDGIERDQAMLQDVVARLRASEDAVDFVLTLPTLAVRAPEVRAAVLDLSAKDTALRAARARYTDEHKIVQDLVAQANDLRLNTIPRLVAARQDQMARRARELQSTIGATAQELEGIPPRTLEELRLRRNVTLAEGLFGKVEAEYESAQLAEAGMVGDVSVLDRAVAASRTPTNRALQALLLFTTLGGGAGLALALLLDGTDKRLRYTDQIRDDLDLWVLGTVPRLRRRKSGASIQSAQLVESFRSIRVSVMYALGADAPVQLAVTSPNVGDGKSLVAANLAISFAEAGYRTLLIDGDIRRGTLHDLFGASRRPGLLDCLATGLSLDEAVIRTAITNLSFLPSGTRYRQGPEMLAGPGLVRLVAAARTTHDVIIIDSPPMGVGSDALWESVAAGAVAIVLRLNASDRKLARAKLEMLDRLPVQVLGAVLNDCPMPDQTEYSHYLSADTVDVDTAIPQQASRIGLLGSGVK